MKLVFILALFWGFDIYAQILPNQEEWEEIARMAAIAAHIEDDQELVINLDTFAPEDNVCLTEMIAESRNVVKVTDKKIITKEKESVSFFYQFTGPVEDMRLMDIELDRNKYLDSLGSVIRAQDEGERKAAISNLCSGKSSLEKIQFGSILFSLLGDVYNLSMVDGGEDQFSALDPTKKPDDVQTITLQRQYNALNRRFYGGNTDWPEKAGVCRHASTLVSEFFRQCGMDATQLSYATADSGHATVKAVDPTTGKSYFLNWSELIEGESPSGLTNFDIPSESNPGRGMVIRYRSPDEEGKILGTSRTNKGVVMARLLHTADDELDYTTYTTHEEGAVIDLGTKRVYKVKTGNWKEVQQEIIFNIIQAANADQSIKGASVSYKREGIRHFGDHLYWKNKLQTSVGLFTEDQPFSTGDGFGVTQQVGTSVGFKTGSKTFFSTELGGDLVVEGYQFQTKMKSNGYESKSDDDHYYLMGSFRAKLDSPRNYVELNASARVTADDDMQGNGPKEKYHAAIYNPKVGIIYSYKVSDSKSLGASMNYVGSFDRQFIRSEILYSDSYNKWNASGGFTVIKTVEDKNYVYTVIKASKDFDLKAIDLKTSVSAQKSLSTSAPVMVTGTVVITPQWKKKK